MADRVITAEALITARDGTGDVFTKIASKLQGIGKSAKSSVEIDKMTAALERQRSQLLALEKTEAARAKFASARTQFRSQQTAVEQAAKALAGAAKPTRELEAAYKRTQVAVARASAEFEKQKTALLAAKHAAEGFGAPLSNIANQQAKLRSSIESTTAAIQKQSAAELHAAEAAARSAAAHRRMEREQERRSHEISHHGIINYALGAAAGAVSAHGIVHVGERAFESGAELQHERVASLNAGRTLHELKEFEETARKVAIARPTASYTESMKTLLETTSAFGSTEHAMEHLDFMMKTASVLKASSGGKIKDSAGEMGQKFAKFFEMRGVAGNGEQFQREGDELTRAMMFSGGSFNPHEMFNFATQAKAALRGYDQKYLTRVMPSLVGEQGGERTGTAGMAGYNTIMGKARDAKQAKQWMDLGLLDPKLTDMKNGQAISWRAGAVKNTDIAMRNPLEWFEGTVLPAMRAKGINVDDKNELSKVLATMFRNQNANMWANEHAQLADRIRLHKDDDLIGKTADPETAYKRNLAMDPTVAMTALTASLDSLGAAVTAPGMQAAAGVITGLSGALTHLADAASNHPMAAMAAGAATGAAALGGAGYASYQIMNGFGLGTSATALDASAVALDGAAAALTQAAAVSAGGKGLLGGALGAAEKGAVGAAEGALGGLARPGMKAAGLLGMGTIGSAGLLLSGLLGFDAAMIYGAPAVFGNKKGARYGGKQGVSEDDPDHPGMHFVAAPRRGSSGYWEKNPEAPVFSGGSRGYLGTPHPALAPISDKMPALPSFTGFGAGGPITAVVDKPVDVTGKVQLEGQASVSISVKVDGGTVTNQVSSSQGNIKVSTGSTMPGAKSTTSGSANIGK